LCTEEELFKGTTIDTPPSKFDSYKPQLFQVPLCAISSSYYFSSWVLAATTASACGERKDDATTLV
jgi:hypothetical protein